MICIKEFLLLGRFNLDVCPWRAAQTFSLSANFQLQFWLPPHPAELRVRISGAVRILSGSWFLSLKWIWIGAGDRWNAANQTRGGTEKTICEMFFKTDISGLFSVMEEYQHSVPLPQHSQQRSQHTVLANSKKVELCKMAFGHGSFFWVHFKGRILGAVGKDFRHNAQGCRKWLSLR